MVRARVPITRRKALAGMASVSATVLASSSGMATPADVVGSVVGIRASVPPDTRTAARLGRVRTGTGTLLDNGGLVLTLGRLVVEADHVVVLPPDGTSVPANIIAYDEQTCLGLVRTATPLSLPPAALGKSGLARSDERLLAMSASTPLAFTEVRILDRRPFAASWEYALDEAIFTAPQHADLAGAALVDRQGTLIGVGALAMPAQPARAGKAGLPPSDLFIPVDALKTALGDLLSMGHRDAPARPWLGLWAKEAAGQVRVTSVSVDGPAARAGLAHADVILRVGQKGVHSLMDLWHGIWSLGSAGTVVALRIRRGAELSTLEITSMDRRHWLRWPQSF
jgi:S1-C subfamily serine protease